MTVDYTKIQSQKTPPEKAAEITPTTPPYVEERICTQCYWVGKPREIQHGTWPRFLLGWFFLWPVMLVIKLVGIFADGNTRYSVQDDNRPENFIFRNLPDFETPYTLYECRNCNASNSLVPLKSREGEQAMYWHNKEFKRNNFDKS